MTAAISGKRQPVAHDARRLLEIADRLEQGTAISRMRACAGPPQAGFLEQDVDLEQVGDARRLRDDIGGDRSPGRSAHAPRRRRGRWRARTGGLVRIVRERAGEQARAGELGAEQGDAARLGEREIIGLDAGDLEQFGDDPLVDVGILPQVERGEMEAERLDRADQPARAVRQTAR